MNNFQECRAGTNPTNAHSVLALQAPTSTNWTRAVNLAWQSTPRVVYSLERGATPATESFSSLRTNITALTGSTNFTDTNVASSGPYFYRLSVH